MKLFLLMTSLQVPENLHLYSGAILKDVPFEDAKRVLPESFEIATFEEVEDESAIRIKWSDETGAIKALFARGVRTMVCVIDLVPAMMAAFQGATYIMVPAPDEEDVVDMIHTYGFDSQVLVHGAEGSLKAAVKNGAHAALVTPESLNLQNVTNF